MTGRTDTQVSRRVRDPPQARVAVLGGSHDLHRPAAPGGAPWGLRASIDRLAGLVE